MSKLDAFKSFLQAEGYEIQPPVGIWEALRARKEGRRHPLIVYRGAGTKEHLSLTDQDVSVVRKFLKEQGGGTVAGEELKSATG